MTLRLRNQEVLPVAQGRDRRTSAILRARFHGGSRQFREIVGAPGEAVEAVENVPRTPRFPRAPTATATAGIFTAMPWKGLTRATGLDLNRVSAKSREAQYDWRTSKVVVKPSIAATQYTS